MSASTRPEATGTGSAQQDVAGAEDEDFAKSEAGELPTLDFATFVLSLSHSALVHLGDAPSPVDGRYDKNPPMARQTIDLLSLIEQKTRGNLTGEEERVLQQVLYDLQMRYVEVARGA
jgi:hypothetical protein